VVEHLTPLNQPYNVLLAQVQQGLIDVGQSAGQAAAEISQMMVTQVAVLAYNDVFLITAGLSLLMVPAALLMSGIKTKSGGGAH
jgi:DHA2 family multidrug resistance protein